MCNMIEIRNTANDSFLPKKSKPESDQALDPTTSLEELLE